MPKFDAASFTAAALGARATHAPPPLATGKASRAIVTMRVMTIGPERRSTNENARECRTQRVILVGTPGFPDNACTAYKTVSILNGGRVLRVQLLEKDAEDKAQKQAKRAAQPNDAANGGGGASGGKAFPERVKRNLVGHYDFEMGSVFDVDLHDRQHPERMTPNTVYVVHVSEFRNSIYGISANLSAFARVGAMHELSIDEQRRLLVAAVHSTQLLPHMMPLLYGGTELSMEQAKKLRMGDFRAETRHMKTTMMLPLIAYNTAELTASRWMRGMFGTHFQEPSLSLLTPEQWPRMVTGQTGTSAMCNVRFQLSVLQRLLRDPERAPELTPAEKLAEVFATNEALLVCSFYRQGFWAAGVCDERNMFDHGAACYFIVGTPMLIPSYLSSVPMPESQHGAGASVKLDFTMSGSKESRDVDGAIAFPFEGAVNTGYPIDHASAHALLVVLGEKDKTRFNDMNRVRNRIQSKSVGEKLPEHWMQTDNPLIINLLESYQPIDEMSDAVWQMVVVPNLASKCSVTESLGYTALKELVETRGFDEACKAFGGAFVSLARGDPVLEPALTKVLRPETPREFNFLLFAVSRDAIARTGVSFLNSRNHVALLEAAFKEIYPSSFSDMGEIADDEIDLDEVDRLVAAKRHGSVAPAVPDADHALFGALPTPPPAPAAPMDDGESHVKAARAFESDDE